MLSCRTVAIAFTMAVSLTLGAVTSVNAEGAGDVAALNQKAEQVYGEGRYKEAAAIAEGALALAGRTLAADHPDMLTSINNLAAIYLALGRYGEAEPLAKRALDGYERTLGLGHTDTLQSINNLAALYFGQGRYGEAEPLFKRALGGYERLLGNEHSETLKCLSSLAFLYNTQGRYSEAEPIYERALAGFERTVGAAHPDTLTVIDNLAGLYHAQGRYSEAEPLYKRALTARERALGQRHPNTLTSVNNLGFLYQAQGRYSEAEPFYKRALAGYESSLGAAHPSTLQSLNNVAFLYQAQGHYSEAEPLFTRVLVSREGALGTEHPDTLASVNNLAGLYAAQRRYGEAEPLLKRALSGYQRALGAEHPDTFRSISNLGFLYRAQERYGEAEPLFKAALASRERALGMEHPDTLASVSNLASLYQAQGRYDEAGPLYRRAFDGHVRVLGPKHPNTLTTLNNLAGLHFAQGRYDEAEPLLKRALSDRESVLGASHPDTLTSVNNLAALCFARGDWACATKFWRRSTAAIAARAGRGGLETSQAITGKKKSEAEQLSSQFTSLVKAVHRLPASVSAATGAEAREMFEIAQWAQSSEAAQSLVQMAVRGAKGDAKLAAQVRERQDLVLEWQKRDALRNAAFGQAPENRNAKAEADNQSRLAAAGARIDDIDRELAAKFPDYAILASLAPLPIEEARAQLGEDEALVVVFDTPEAKPAPEETFIWVLTRANLRWVRSDLGTAAVSREVQALRCGLDSGAWDKLGCAGLGTVNYNETDRDARKPLPFDHARAYKLYKALFGQVEDLTKNKHLLIVPSGPLTQLPFQVLVTTPPPADGNHKAAAWLIRDHALTVLPAVSSLKALRRVARPSAAKKPMIGFGNPLLDGNQSDLNFGQYFRDRAQLALDKRQCAAVAPHPSSRRSGVRRGVTPLTMRGGLADLSLIRSQLPLPETADELCAVASDLRVDPREIRLGARATEREVKRLSANGLLAQYRIVHFATHGALAGEVSGNSESGLLLTPPAQASEEDDGYLMASEIAALKLDADWVILSACNTAAGDAPEAQALSGLARAFFYAQARALLVSHWEVDSNATVTLITTAVREMSRDKSVGRAEALRRSMLALIAGGKPEEAHPSYWAPFVLVGEGGAGR
jgi:CHAT domain-containing protein/tetratricopeptide (TPR) repeat protein